MRDVIEAPYGGFCSTYGGTYDLQLGDKRPRQRFREMNRNGFKRYSSLASSHTSVDAMRAIRETPRHPWRRRGQGVEIGTTNMVYVHCGWPYEPKETITAQMNLPYTAAVTLLEGNAFVDQYTDDKLRDPEDHGPREPHHRLRRS